MSPLFTATAVQEPNMVILLGIPFHDVTMGETLDYIDGMVERRKPAYLATANLDFAAQASHDVELQRILFDAELVLCDGTPLVWASRWIGAPLRERVAGSDLLPHLFQRAEEKGHRLFFLGSTDEVLRIAIEKCAQQYPKLVVAGSYAPPFAKLLEIDGGEISERIAAAQPDILLVAMGCPKQEKWIYMNYRKLGVPVSIGIGASLDFIAGKFRRAPEWARVCGLEWVFRLMQEPGRLLNRYYIDLLFFVRELRRQHRLLALGGATAPAAARGEPVFSHNLAQYQWSGRIDVTAVRAKTVEALSPEPQFPFIALDCSRVTFIDSTGLGLLIATFRRCKEAGGTFLLVSPSPAVLQILAVMRLDRLIPTANTPGEIRQCIDATAPGTVDFSFVQPGTKCLTVSLSGDVTSATVADCERTIHQRWSAMPESLVLSLDLERVSFIDSSGLGLLIKTFKLVQQRPDATLKLANVQPNVRNVIRLANMDTVLGLASEPIQS